MSEQQPTETHPTRISKVGAVLLSAAFALIAGLVVGALQIAGVVSMGVAHFMIALAWVITVLAVWGWLSTSPRKHVGRTVLLTAFASGIVFSGLDILMVRLKAEQEHRPPPSLGEWLSPVTAYLQSLPWLWTAISLAVGFLLAVWLLRGKTRNLESPAWLDTIVDYQRRGMRKYVLVEKCEVDTSPLLNGKRYVEFTFHIRNYSMFHVSIPMPMDATIEGSIYFKGDRLSGTAKLVENKVVSLRPYLSEPIKIHQWVDADEAKDIPETLEKVGNRFNFSNAVIHIKADEFPDDKADTLDLTRGMQNAELENKVIQLVAVQGQRALEFGEWQRYSDIAFRLNLVYGMAQQARHTMEFPGNTPLPKDVLEYLRAHIDSAIHQCLGPEARDDYFDHVPPVPDEDSGQEYWIRSHCSRLEALIEQQHRQVIARKPTTQHL
jgi:hypothetical protein